MHQRNLAVIVLAAVSLVASCGETIEQQNRRLREEYYQRVLVELPKLEERLFTTPKELDKGIVKGGNLFYWYCAPCHGEYGEGSQIERELKNIETGEIKRFSPPEIRARDPFSNIDPKGLGEGIADRIKNGFKFMPPTAEFPHDKSGNPLPEDVNQLIFYIRNASKLASYREFYNNGKPN